MKWLVVVSLDFISVDVAIPPFKCSTNKSTPNGLHVIETYELKVIATLWLYVTLQSAFRVRKKNQRKTKPMSNKYDLIWLQKSEWTIDRLQNFNEWQSTQSIWAVNESSSQS